MSRPLRILHAPTNVAGIAGLLAAAQRELGEDAVSVEYMPHPYGFSVDRSLGVERGAGLARRARAVAPFVLGAIARYDVFHLYFGHSLLPAPFVDLPLLRALRKRIVLHFCGCEVRERDATLRQHEISCCAECVTLACRGLRHPRPSAAHTVFVSTPDLIEFVPGATLLPHPVDLDEWRPTPGRQRTDRVRILHAPTDRHIKGTRHLVTAVDRLRSEGHSVELEIVEGVPQSEIVRRFDGADLVVDQLMAGSYGTVAANAMAKGLPVLARIRDDLRPYYAADLPIVDAGPGDVYDVLRTLLSDRASWAELGRRGIAYAKREHDVRKVAAEALAAYGGR